MDIQPILALAGEASTALTLLLQATEKDRPSCVSSISECNRRASSGLADFHARQFRTFVSPLPRPESADVAEALHAVTGAVFATALLLPPRASGVGEHRREELSGLCRMGAMLSETAATLPHFVRGKQPPTPDTFRFYAEQNKVRASHAMSVLHGEKSLFDRALNESLASLSHALSAAWQNLLVLMMASV